MRPAYFPMNSLGTLGHPGESLVPVVSMACVPAGNVPGDFSPDSQCAGSRIRVLGFPAHIKHLAAHGAGGLLTNRSYAYVVDSQPPSCATAAAVASVFRNRATELYRNCPVRQRRLAAHRASPRLTRNCGKGSQARLSPV